MLIVAERPTDTDVALVAALRRRGVAAVVSSERRALARARPGDLALGRVDVLPTLDGTSGCIWTLRKLEDRGVRVLNGVGALLASHDKLITALRLDRAAVPHPPTAHVDERSLLPKLRYPVVVKPRFGSWGRDVVRCETARELGRHLAALRRHRWFRKQGALVQELIPPVGHDLRVIVAGSEIVGAIRRIAAPGEWRTNVALGATRSPVEHLPAQARRLAIAAAQTVQADLVGVDLLPTSDGYTVLELNGAACFTEDYSLNRRNVFDEAARALIELATSGRGGIDRRIAGVAG